MHFSCHMLVEKGFFDVEVFAHDVSPPKTGSSEQIT